MKRILLLLAIVAVTLTAEAQESFKFGNVTKADLLKTDYPIAAYRHHRQCQRIITTVNDEIVLYQLFDLAYLFNTAASLFYSYNVWNLCQMRVDTYRNIQTGS